MIQIVFTAPAHLRNMTRTWRRFRIGQTFAEV
jgi:hypothetical protein